VPNNAVVRLFYSQSRLSTGVNWLTFIHSSMALIYPELVLLCTDQKF